jgi:phospholipid/cholesterol/gamma-HCH transport system ATP-binding protein
MVTHELPSIFAIASNSIYLDNVKRTITAEGDPKDMVRESREPVVRDFLTREGTFVEAAAASPAASQRI